MASKKLERKTEVPANWRTSDELRSIAEVAAITGFSEWTVRQDCKKGTIIPVLNRKPYKFHASEIVRVYLTTPREPANVVQIRSLKREEARKTAVQVAQQEGRPKRLW